MTGGAGPKRKGAGWEREVRDYLRNRGYTVERAYGAGRPDDVGDILVEAWVPLLVECKNVATTRRGQWLDEARAKVASSRPGAIPVVIEKRRGRGRAADCYVTLDLCGFVDLIDEIADRIAALDERSPEEIARYPRARTVELGGSEAL